ncbi:hypothetical protein DYU11_19075 [Fibrisoma montanum]|uniref:Uncharacterized protein n=1 Tax=Fibrisoma montanum TaxID=2305895 RepID=A0A418M6T3_9BACT|nr:hypothetical protein [Fibrisoma montanum]RIV21506.1 hypothetical protein DYU11_19075 [Fibrisoma montanum]
MKEFFLKKWVRHSLVGLGMLIVWQIGAFALRYMARSNGEQILAPLSKNSSILKEGMKTLSTLEKSNLQRLLNLFDRIENQKEQHKAAFLEFYPYHFASSALLLILSSISVVLLFLTAQVGMNNTSPYVRTIFFTLAALTAFYALSPLVFKQETNISTNLRKFILYDNLEGELYNYAVTNPNVTSSNDTLPFNKFHSSITKTMAEINSINVEFDYKVIPVPDFGLTKP